MVRPTLPSLAFIVAEGNCDGDICKVQVSLKLLIIMRRIVKKEESFVQMTC